MALYHEANPLEQRKKPWTHHKIKKFILIEKEKGKPKLV